MVTELQAADRKVSLFYLFWTFVKIGVVSFGGHMALISVVQREMVAKDEVLEDDVVLDAVSIASLLPGPLAVNVVTFIGYHFRGKLGALVSLCSILLPACILMLLLSYAYFGSAYSFKTQQLMYFIPSVVGAIVLSTGVHLFKNSIGRHRNKIVLCVIAIVVQFVFKTYLVTIGLILVGAIVGALTSMFNLNKEGKEKSAFQFKASLYTKIVLSMLLFVEVLFISNAFKFVESLYLKIGLVFSGISLSLFGGGYVMIPIMQALFVNDLQWLNQQEFIDAIAFSQITPGPILVSATFIGYKLAGFFGALLATLCIFIPSATLMILVSEGFRKNKEHHLLRSSLDGIKAVVIGLIIASGLEILQKAGADFMLIAFALITFILNYKFKVSPIYLIICSIGLGLLLKVYL